MKNLVYVWMAFLAVTISFSGCKQTTPKTEEVVVDSDSIVVNEIAELDSTVYGVCGEGTAMHTIELITDGGDTLFYSMFVEDEADVAGGMMVGDRLAIIGKNDSEGLTALRVINLTTLLGKWTSLDKNFEIVEGGMVNSNVEAESNPWVSWKILNGQLLLNTDTFDIVELGADSLYLENKTGIFAYKRVM